MSGTETSEWQAVATLDELGDGGRKLLDLGGNRQIGLFRVGEAVYAVGAWCSHQKMSLMNGPVQGHELMCPLHGARFDLRTGKNLSLPAVKPIPAYEVKVEAGTVYLRP